MKFVVPGDANAVLIDGLSVLVAPGKDPDLGHARQMRGVEAADGSGSDDEDAFGH